MKTGLLGGSFNPFHNAHLALAQSAVKQQFVEQVWFIPTFIHPLKSNDELLNFQTRLALINKVIKNIPYLKAFDFEKKMDNISYTANLMKFLYQQYPQHEFLFIIGYDILAEIKKWSDYSWLKKNVDYLIINRNSKEKLTINQIDSYQFLKIDPIEISSTEIRNLIKNHKSIHNLVPKVIENDIVNLYS